MINIGQFNPLTITRFTDHGAYVDGGEVGEILVPKAYVTKSMRPGDTLELFVYLDQSERLVATTEQPLAMVGDFAYLEVAWVNEHGAFLNWGVMKDLFVPFRQQKRTMEVGESYIVFVDIDEETGRLMATAKIDKHLRPAREHYYHRGEEVDLLVWQRTELGLKVIVDNCHAGLVYNDQLFAPEPKTGDRLRGTVVNVRPDGRIDVSLQRLGKSRFRDFAEVLYEELQAAPEGFLPFTDESSSDDISARFGVSKKTFKRAVGTLYREKKIVLEEGGIRKS
ncbi:S1 RNA-binding domain-containing protein [Alloprevotella sp. oral taxon 473]|uniref:CvfB family protein n=1 Tax=Alloprevotella sp. oral taxon 473 TaxID=712469 RepID=UPI0002A1C371|nr:S1-like domain-containing RNA-binding protein [Alloprevotella sp. oral taxon 473]EKX93332.1 YitL family protein [Alloprevotella sp. oral taxon 473 str. F0040]